MIKSVKKTSDYKKKSELESTKQTHSESYTHY
jgi:hypothetical protein